MNYLHSNTTVDFLMWRKTYAFYCEQFAQGYIDQKTLALRMDDLGFSVAEIKSEIDQINIEFHLEPRRVEPQTQIGDTENKS